jgi:hypothetical protein
MNMVKNKLSTLNAYWLRLQIAKLNNYGCSENTVELTITLYAMLAGPSQMYFIQLAVTACDLSKPNLCLLIRHSLASQKHGICIRVGKC